MSGVSRFHPLLAFGGLTIVAFLANAVGIGGAAGVSDVVLAPVQLTGFGLLAAGAPFTPLLGFAALAVFLTLCLLLDRATTRIFHPWLKATKRSSPS